MKAFTHNSLLAALLALVWQPQAARAQVELPIVTLRGASGFEGDSGETELTFVASLDRQSIAPVTITVVQSSFVIVASGQGLATGGTAAGPGVDFIFPGSQTATIPPGGTKASFTVRVLGDTTIEPDEILALTLQSVSGAQPNPTGSTGFGFIVNDDGPPLLTIDDISATEPISRLSTRIAHFTVSLSHPPSRAVSVDFTTQNGSATGGSDYVATSGRLTIPAGTMRSVIPVTLLGDLVLEPNETFVVALSNPLEAIFGGLSERGVCTIRDALLGTGAFDFSPDKSRVPSEQPQLFTVVWTVPEGEVWRDLKTIDLRLRDGHGAALWVRWDQSANTFALAEPRGKRHDHRRHGHRHHDDDDCEDAVVFGPGYLPGTDQLLATRWASLDLLGSSVTGSGADGATVTLQLAITFPRKSAGHAYRVELAASDDLGHDDAFTNAGTIFVQHHRRNR
jgi:hypothetical protein